MAPRVMSILTALAIVIGTIAPALAQTSSPPAKGSGGTQTPQTPPSTTQPGAPTQSTPQIGTGAGASGKAKTGTDMGQSGASKPTTSTNGSASSEQVKDVQKALQDKGMDPGPVDGIMGPKTMAALKAFQKDQKLPESGRLDDQTREKLGVAR